jgi:hypothetical protein
MRSSDIVFTNFRNDGPRKFFSHENAPRPAVSTTPKRLGLNASIESFLHDDEVVPSEKISVMLPLVILVLVVSMLISVCRLQDQPRVGGNDFHRADKRLQLLDKKAAVNESAGGVVNGSPRSISKRYNVGN